MSQFIEMFGDVNSPKAPVYALGDICEIHRGGSPRPISKYITNDPDGLNWIKIGDADDTMFISKTAERIIPEGLNKTRKVFKGDLLLSNSMSFGHPYILNIDGCIHDGWLVLHFDHNRIHPIFLCKYLGLPSTYVEMSKLASGGVVLNLNSEIIKKLPVILPNSESQMDYLEIAEQADKSEFGDIKSQFIEMFTNNNFEMVPLGDLCDKISDGSHNPPKGIENSKYLMISSKNVFKDHLDLTDVRYLTEEDFEVENKRTNVKANDVLLTIVGTIGRTYLVKGDEGNLVMQRSVAVLTPNSRVTPLFLMFYLHSDKNLEKEGRGNAQKGIYLKQLSQYEIKVPSIDLQKQFEAIYRQADKSESAQELVRNINYN